MRTWMSVASVAFALVACGKPSGAGRAVRVPIGTLEAYALADGHLVLPNDGTLLGVGHAPREIGDVLAAAKLPRDTIQLDIQCLLVKADGHVMLFDTGTGDANPKRRGQLPGSLARAGVRPDAVTDIFISHAHSDHVGGLITKTGMLVFPGATIHISKPEWAAFQAEATNDEDAERYVSAMTPKVSAFEPGAQVLPTVKAVATPGHTRGHSSYEITDGSEKLFYLGDLAHHVVISLQRPAWSISVDADQHAAETVREQTLTTLAADHTLVFAPHFPYPGVGHIVADGPAFRWQ